MVVRIVGLIIFQGRFGCKTRRKATHHTLYLLLIWKLADSFDKKIKSIPMPSGKVGLCRIFGVSQKNEEGFFIIII